METAYTAIQSGEIKAEISFVFCSREPGESRESDLFLDLVRSYQILLVYFSFDKFKAQRSWPGPELARRAEYDREVMRLLQGFRPDLCVLAGYMLIVSPEMCRQFTMINLHPAAPGGPTGTWQEVIWQLMAQRASQSGVMMHLVTPELDRGPAVTYCTYSIRGGPFDRPWQEVVGKPVEVIKRREGENNPLFQLIRQEGLKREFPLILTTLKAFSEGRVKIEAGKVLDGSGQPVKGYNLTEEIEARIGG